MGAPAIDFSISTELSTTFLEFVVMEDEMFMSLAE